MKSLALLLLLTVTEIASAQSILVYPFSRKLICVGDSILVHYSAVGTYEQGNVFVIQLSDANGSFSNFRNVGSSMRSTDAVYVRMTQSGAKFKVRVISSAPYQISDDTGEELGVLPIPTPEVQFVSTFGLSGQEFIASIRNPNPKSKYYWTIGPDATPSTNEGLSISASFASAGTKRFDITEENEAGCRGSGAGATVQVYSCQPTVPANARIVTGTAAGTDSFVVVRPGATYTAQTTWSTWQMVFVEPGGTAISEFRNSAVYYVKAGGSYISNSAHGNPTAIFESGSALTLSDHWRDTDTLRCQDLSFTAAIGAVRTPDAGEITIASTEQAILVSAKERISEVELFDLLGTSVTRMEPQKESVQLPTGNLARGVFYLRITLQSDGSVVTRKILH